MRKAGIALVVSVIALAACGSDDGGGEAKVVERNGTSSSTSSTTTRATRSQFRVGDKIETSRGNTIAIYTYEQPAPPPEFFRPDPGMEYAVADVELCATGDLSTDAFGNERPPEEQVASVNPFDFELVMPDNSRLQPTIAVREPALNSTDLAQDECVRGWVSWEVPAGVRPVAVLDKQTGPPNIRWTV